MKFIWLVLGRVLRFSFLGFQMDLLNALGINTESNLIVKCLCPVNFLLHLHKKLFHLLFTFPFRKHKDRYRKCKMSKGEL